MNLGGRLLNDIRRDLEDVVMICTGQKKQTNHHRQLTSNLTKGVLPKSWQLYTVPADVSVIQWITDFADRVKQLQKIADSVSQGKGNLKVQTIHVVLLESCALEFAF